MTLDSKLIKAKEQHEKWLLQHNCHPSQIKTRKKKPVRQKDFGVAKSYYADQSNSIAPPVMLNTIWEKLRTGNESPQTIAAIQEKAARVGPAFNKGGMQLLPKNQIIYSGKK